MSKQKRSRTSNFSLDLKTQGTGKLPSKEEIEKTIAKATKVESEEPVVYEKKASKTTKVKRIPFTTALTPENRAMLEAAAHEGEDAVADILNKAIEHYFEKVRPLQNTDMVPVFLKIFEKKLK